MMELLAGLLLFVLPVYGLEHDKPVSIPAGQAAELVMSNSAPIYPPKAKADGIEGTVLVFIQVNKFGKVDLARAVDGPQPLRQAAVDAVKCFIYRPYLINGSPAGFRTVVHVKFALEKPRTKPPA